MQRFHYHKKVEIDHENPMASKMNMPGVSMQTFSNFHRPRHSEVKRLLLQLRSHSRESVSEFAVRFGVSRSTMRKWLTGKRSPSGAATRLAWIFWTSVFNQAAIDDAWAWITWQRPGRELTAERMAEMAKELKSRRRKGLGHSGARQR